MKRGLRSLDPTRRLSALGLAACLLCMAPRVSAAPSESARAENAGAARGEECDGAGCEPGALARVFVHGSSSGEPSTAKLVTVYSIYALAVGSLAFGGVMLFDHFEGRDTTQEFIDGRRNPGPCYALTSPDCQRLEELRAEEQSSRSYAALGLASAGTLLLAGVFTAEQWSNVQPSFVASEEGASLYVRFNF